MKNCLPEANVVTVRLGLVNTVITDNGYIIRRPAIIKLRE
jgi:hypothetical protein